MAKEELKEDSVNMQFKYNMYIRGKKCGYKKSTMAILFSESEILEFEARYKLEFSNNLVIYGKLE